MQTALIIHSLLLAMVSVLAYMYYAKSRDNKKANNRRKKIKAVRSKHEASTDRAKRFINKHKSNSPRK